MHYRQLGIRYTMILAAGQAPGFTEVWGVRRETVILAGPCWRPPTDVYETAGAILITIELAGVSEEDLTVLLFEDALVVEGRRELPPCEVGGVYQVVAIRQGPFRVEVPLLVPVDPDRVELRHERGLLHVRLLKANGGYAS